MAILIALSAAGAFCQGSPFPSGEAQAVSNTVPNLVRYEGRIAGIVNAETLLRISIYAAENADSPLWQEKQLVRTGVQGEFAVLLGAGSAVGLPEGIFVGSEPRWLGIKAGERDEQRMLMVSVPYAMKAADAGALGGEPAGNFVTQEQLAAKLRETAAELAAKTPLALPAATPTGAGTAGYLAQWTSASALGDSSVFQTGSGATGKVGIRTTTPATALDVNGQTTLRGTVALPSAAVATATAGSPSAGLELSASSYDSTKKAAVAQSFVWQAQPVSNNTADASSKLTLLFGAGTATPAATGLSIGPDGVITFASKQTFPGGGTGSGDGTITGVTAGSGLTGGGTTGKVTLAVDPKKVPLLGSENTFTEETAVTADSTDWALVVTNTSTAAKGTLLAQAQGAGLSIEGASPSGTGVLGATNGGYGVEGSATTGLGGYFHNTSTSDAALAGEAGSTAGTAVGVYGSAANGSAVYGTASGIGNGVAGISVNGWGVSGASTTNNGVNGSSTSGYGVLGFSKNSYGVAGESSASYGVYGNSTSGIAIYGSSTQSIAIQGSVPATDSTGAIYGLVGDGNQWNGTVPAAVSGNAQGDSIGVSGMSDTEEGGFFGNNNSSVATVFAENNATGKNGDLPQVVLANSPFGTCGFGGNGDVTCTGQVKSLVTTASSRRVETYSVQSSENWLEDYGTGTLKNGIATIKLDEAFLDAVNTGVEYHVFLTPKGDANTLFVTGETANGFEVRESSKGKSSIAFDYRIVAKRRGHETERLVDVTGKLEAEIERARPKRPFPAIGRSH